MARQRDLELNTFDRYVKQSDRLVLEAYSSCEVPLGCGGAILRWIDPRQSIPLVIYRDFGDRGGKVFIDGALHERPRLDLAPGSHVIALVFDSLDIALTFRLLLEYDKSHAVPSSRAKLPNARLATADDSRWYGTSSAPSGEWLTDTRDVEGWVSLRAMPPPTRSKDRWADHRLEKIPSIGMTSKPGTVWVRRVFTLDGETGSIT